MAWCLPVGGSVLLWLLGYGVQDRTAIILMALLITATGGYLVLAKRQGRQ